MAATTGVVGRGLIKGRVDAEELRAALDRWIEQTHDLGAVPEAELIKRGLVKDVSDKYADRRKE